MFIAEEDEQVYSIVFETKQKEYVFGETNVFYFDIIETDDKIIE